MLCDWLKFKVDIQLFLSYGVYASVIFVIFFAEVKYMISPNGRGYISKVVGKLVRNNALISFSRVFMPSDNTLLSLGMKLHVLSRRHGK